MTIFAKNNRLDVYSGTRPGGGHSPIATINLGSQRTVNSDNSLAYDPRYTHKSSVQGSAYFFNLGKLLRVAHGYSCTLFEAETDYPLARPLRSIGADSIGNHIGRELFGSYTFTFWILFEQENYIIPDSGDYDYEAQIVCTDV